MVKSVRGYLALGSNLGDRRDFLKRAVERLRTAHGILRVGEPSLVESAPLGGPPGQGRYLNGVVEIETTLAPRELLRTCLDIENALGRTRSERWGPRTIDIDILLYGDEVVMEPDLEIPHPRMGERWFVLVPLARVAPTARHPICGLTAAEMLEALKQRQPEVQEEIAWEHAAEI